MEISEISDFRIVFPRGNRKQLCVVEIVPALDYEINDYAVASSKTFTGDENGAVNHAKYLAEKHGLDYTGSNGELGDLLD